MGVEPTTKRANSPPCTYRGYYYDQETGWYYLQSRYYDPEIGRFLNADEADLIISGESLASLNAFIYCENNPLNKDPSGYATIGIIVGALFGFGLGTIIMPRIADAIGLRGWGRTVFIAAGMAALTALGGYIGNYIGNAILAIYKAGGSIAATVNRIIAYGIARIAGGSVSPAKGNGWVIKISNLTLRVMTSSNFRNNYFRLSMAGKGTITLSGVYSSDPALTHIPITFNSIVSIIKIILRLK